MTKLVLEDDHKCFACGLKNPDGLRVEWKVEGFVMTAEFTIAPKYQSWKGIAHGGIIATLLDEAMARLSSIVCGAALTAEMTVRYVAPALIGEKLYIRGEVVKDSRRMTEMKASIHDASGKLIAHSTGKAVKI